MNNDKVIYANPGCAEQPVFEIGLDENGVKTLVPVMVNGKQKTHNVQDEIQSHFGEVDIKTVVAKALNGDMSAINSRTPLNKGEAVFDGTAYQKSVNELHQLNLQNEAVLRSSYANYKGADKISFNEYCEALKTGNIDKLKNLVEEAPANGNDQ